MYFYVQKLPRDINYDFCLNPQQISRGEKNIFLSHGITSACFIRQKIQNKVLPVLYISSFGWFKKTVIPIFIWITIFCLVSSGFNKSLNWTIMVFYRNVNFLFLKSKVKTLLDVPFRHCNFAISFRKDKIYLIYFD